MKAPIEKAFRIIELTLMLKILEVVDLILS